MMSKRIKKKYPRNVADVAKQAEKVSGNIDEHKPDLQKEYPTVFDEEFFDETATLTRKLRSIPSDAALRGHLSTQTAALGELFERFGKLHTKLCATVDEAFRDNPAIKREFGYTRKKDIVENIQALITFLDDLMGLWQEHGPALLAAGCPADLITAFTTLEHDCITRTSQQGSAKDDRSIYADERRETANALWEHLETLESHTKGLYGAGSPEATRFKLNRKRKPPLQNDDDTTAASGDTKA